MMRFTHYLMLVLLLGVSTAAMAATNAVTPATLARQLADNLTDCGSFTQSRRLADLDTTLDSRGTYQRQRDTLIWKTLAPIEDSVVLAPDNDDLPPDMQAILPVFMGLLSGDWRPLQQHFSIDLKGTLDQWQATLEPTDAVVAQQLVQLTMNGASQVENLTLSFSNRDELTLTLSPGSCQPDGDGPQS